MSSDAYQMEASMNEQDESSSPGLLLADPPAPLNSSRNAIKLPKILLGNASPINFDCNYDDLNKFSHTVQMYILH